MNINVSDLLKWGAPRVVNTSRGPRHLCKAAPDARFWGLWRAQQAELRAAGIVPDKRSGQWEICWYSEDPVADKPAQQPFSPMPEPAVQAAAPKDSMKWSPEQSAIFEWFKSGSGNLVVRARAGTGKTTTIKAAFAQAPERRMLYVVFNKKNQIEAERKIVDPRVEVRTLHSLGLNFIRQVWDGVQPNDEVENDRIEVAAANIPDEVAGAVKRLVAFAKNTSVNPSVEDLIDLADVRGIECPGYESQGWPVARIAEVAHDVLALSRERDIQGRVSFNDMVWLPVAMNWVRPQFDLVVVDEAQDMNLPQLLMARGASKSRVVVVGDDRQAIYGFRGAVQDGLDIMKRDLNAAELGLTVTYRCPKSVVALAKALVPDYRVDDSAPEGSVTGLSGDRLVESLEVGDSVLSRVNAPLMPLCLRLLRRNIPARIEGRDIGRALLEIVRKLKARSIPDFIRRVESWGDKQRARAEKSKNAEAKIEVINDQVATLIAVSEACAGMSEIEARLTNLFQDTDEKSKPAVIFSSVHKAKGLEWNRVFILRETFNRKVADEAQAKEEANIYYVAITRAQKHLILVSKS